MLIAVGAAIQSVAFYPVVVRNWRRHYCHFPLWVAGVKLGAMLVSCVGLITAGLPIAAVVVVIDIGSWLVLAGQRLAWGDGEKTREQMLGHMFKRAGVGRAYRRSILCRHGLHRWGAWHTASLSLRGQHGGLLNERHCWRCDSTQRKERGRR
jgi:hypothetical protein